MNAPMVAVDEKWRKIRGRWHSGFVGVAVATALPVLPAFLPSRSPWAWRGIGRQRRWLKHVPRGIITAGLQAYAS